MANSIGATGLPRTVSFSGPRGRRSLGALVGGIAGVAALVASVIVGLSLARIVDRPVRWGVNYDQLFGNPYANADSDIVAPIVAAPDVVAATGANIGSVTINGLDTSTLSFDSAKGRLVPTVLRGREPLGVGEIGLGAEVARRLGVGIGDTVDVVGSSGETRQLDVVGIVVTPDSAGAGAAMTFDEYRALNPESTGNIVLVDFRHDVPASEIDAMAAGNYSPPGSMPTPKSIRALERVTAAPFLLAAVLTVLLLVACGHRLATSVRTRRRDLAILRALGSNSHQLRAVVHWHATLVAALIVIVGVPIGVILGRSIVTLVTDALGIVPGAAVPLIVLAAVVAVAVLLANALVLWPGRKAAQSRTAHLSLDH